MLKVQYRFNEKINSFPSTMLYDGELVPDDSVKDRKLSDLEGVDADDDLDEAVVFFDSESWSVSVLAGQSLTLLCLQPPARQCTSARRKMAVSAPSRRATRTRQSAPFASFTSSQPVEPFGFSVLSSTTSRRSSMLTSRQLPYQSSRPTTARSSFSPRSSIHSIPRSRSARLTAIKVARTVSRPSRCALFPFVLTPPIPQTW